MIEEFERAKGVNSSAFAGGRWAKFMRRVTVDELRILAAEARESIWAQAAGAAHASVV